MKFRWPGLHSTSLLALFAAVLTIAGHGQAEPLPLERAIRLALAHSTSSAIAGADVQRAFASYRELRNNYIPQLVVGSGLGWSYGFPLSIEGSAPALVNAVAQSSVFNPAQRQFLGAAKIDWHASEFQDKDQRNAVIQDVALTYAELAKWEARLQHLRQDEAEAQKMEQAVSERLQEGVDSTVDLNKAKLVAARVRLHRAEARGNADVLRRHLSTLTGLPVSSIELAPETIPALPPVAPEEDLSEKAIASSPAIKFAEQHSLAESMRAAGEHRSLLPSIDFSAQYARLSTFNNYTQYYTRFQADNATVGFALRIPIFNASQRARADAAAAEALKAKKQAEATRNQVAEETLKLQRAAEQLEAAREVAQLEYQLAQSGLEAAQTRIDAKTGTLHELADARVQAAERFLLFQDADFEYQRVRMNLLRATGDLEQWALPSPGVK
ncbi:MAG TPA: TolC family protein [Terriglobales bacterium]|jgi:outer membrane protein TolC|nr:TolC family protein [Terriglobales bacterium]